MSRKYSAKSLLTSALFQCSFVLSVHKKQLTMKKLTTLSAGILLGVSLTYGFQLLTNQAQALRAEGYTQGVEDGEAFADSRWFTAIDYYNEAWEGSEDADAAHEALFLLAKEVTDGDMPE